MNRRSLLSLIGAGTPIGLAGCLDTGPTDTEREAGDREIASVEIESDRDDITADAAIESQFSEDTPGVITVEMTNHGEERTFVFPGFEIPGFGSLAHDEEDAVIRTLSVDHFEVAPPEEPTEGCWMYDLIPPRPSSFAPTTLGPGEGVTATFSLSAMAENDSVPEPCIPVGRYSGTSEIDYSEAPDWVDDIDGVVSLTLDVTLG